jgi:pimeloyl-ACP methyl ester carboxylesterase
MAYLPVRRSVASGCVDLPPLSVDAYPSFTFDGRGFDLVYTRAGQGGLPVLLVHGWPETRRLYWKVIEPLAEAGFDVIVPDLRGFGDSGLPPDGFGDTPSSSRDLHALLASLGVDRVVLVGGDFGGAVVQDMAMRWPEQVAKLVLFNSPLPYLKDRMEGLRSRPPRESTDYFVRQGTDADALAAELATPEQRRRYIATFYTSRFWAHPGAFAPDEVDFHTEPFADADRVRASFRLYEAVFDESARSELPLLGRNERTPTLVLHGTSDHVIPPDFDRMAAQVFADHTGPFLLRDCGHFVPWEASHALVTATAAFCGELLADHRT